jgi:hypothetical protein
MADESTTKSADRLRTCAFLTALALLLTALAWYALPEQTISVDFVCYFSAAKILASGRSPYDAELQTAVQHALGWRQATSGFGVYDYLPYFYPPWFALALVPLLPLGYTAAKLVFFFLNIELTLLAGYLLRDAVPGAPRRLAAVLPLLFIFSVVCTLLAQTSLLMLFLAALAWTLLDRGRDRWAGVALAWLTIKPQLTAVLLLGVLLWAVHRRRWGMIAALFLTCAVLAGACTLIVPSWPVQMLSAPGRTPPPTEDSPWIGNAWFLVLRAAGAQGWRLWLPYLALAVVALGTVVRTALDRTRPLADVMAAGLLAAFFVAPYARHYDFAVLVVPALVLAAGRLPRVAAVAFLLALVIVPYAQHVVLAQHKAATDPDGKFLVEGTYFWVPAALAVLWLMPRRLPRAALAPQAA